jgi:hypothetical protein
MSVMQKIKEIEDEMARTQKNKATMGHLGMLKVRVFRDMEMCVPGYSVRQKLLWGTWVCSRCTGKRKQGMRHMCGVLRKGLPRHLRHNQRWQRVLKIRNL